MADQGPTYHFHVSRAARERYGFSARYLHAHRQRGVSRPARGAPVHAADQRGAQGGGSAGPRTPLRAGDMNAMALIDEILHYVAALYRKQVDRTCVGRALSFAEERLARPPSRRRGAVRGGVPRASPAGREGLRGGLPRGGRAGTPRREIALEEMLLLSLANENPAFRPFSELFDHATLAGGPPTPRSWRPSASSSRTSRSSDRTARTW